MTLNRFKVIQSRDMNKKNDVEHRAHEECLHIRRLASADSSEAFPN